MQHISINETSSDVRALVQSVYDSNEPLMLVGSGKNTVMISEEEWRSIQETLYLSSVPGMEASIIEGMKTPLNDCSDTLTW